MADSFEAAPQDLVMTLLGAFVDPRDRPVWSGGLVELLAGFGFSAGAARVALNRLVHRDLLARDKAGRLVHYRITPRSAAVLAEGDRRIFTLGRTPRVTPHWTVLWHSIPERRRLERTRLVRRLRFLGFGPAQDGSWVAPHDRERELASLLRELDVTEHAGVLLGRPAGSLDFGAFVARVWDLDDLEDRYRGFVAEFGGRDQDRLDDRDAFLLRTRLTHSFRQFPFLDPELPEDLVSPPEHRAEAIRLFDDLYAVLAVPAQRYFDRVMQP